MWSTRWITIRNEFRKLRTVRSPLALLGGAQLLVVASVSGLFISTGSGADPRQNVPEALAHAGLVSFFSLVLGILAVAGEYRHRTISDTYLCTPRRSVVITAKLTVYSLAGLVFGLVSSITAIVTAAIWLGGKGSSLDLTSATVWQTTAGCTLMNAAFAAIGVGVGALIRNLTAAIAAGLVWLALVEGIAGQLIGDSARWLPFASGLALEGVPVPGRELLTPWLGGLVLAGYAAVIALVSISTTVRRDVT